MQEDLLAYESCRVCLLYKMTRWEEVEALSWVPKEQGQRKDASQWRYHKARLRLELGRLCMAASAYTGLNCERPLFCSQWKAAMGHP